MEYDFATINNRPTLREAADEALISPDTHWTSTLSTIGMTRIKRSTVTRAWIYTDWNSAVLASMV